VSQAKKERNEDIKAAYEEGELMTDLAEWHQISKQRVFEICTGYVSPSQSKCKRRSKANPTNRILHRHTRFIKIRFAVLKRDNFTCQYCGRKAPDVSLHVDHVIPRSRGGTDAMANLKTACADCNLGKYDVLLDSHKQSNSIGPSFSS